jgi:purine-binding chemotaxis protein CheW
MVLDATAPILLVEVQGLTLGVPSADVIEIGHLPHVTPVVEGPAHLMGLATLSRQTVPVANLRTLLGFPPLQDERTRMVEMLTQRERDHIDWLEALERSLREGIPFAKARSPHECAFGKWYDAYRTDYTPLAVLLREFDAPHRRIHALADRLLALAASHRTAEALNMLNETRQTDLHLLIDLFARARELVSRMLQDMLVVVTVRDRWLGLTVDAIATVVTLAEPPVALPPAVITPRNAFLTHSIRLPGRDRLGLLLHVEALPVE